MQHSVVPDLAHTRTRPIHWVATATAVSAVVALSSVLQPDAATAAQAAGPETGTTRTQAAPPDPAAVTFPLDCASVEPVVVKKATGDLDGDGRPETVAVVHCDAPMGTPPDGVYVLTRGSGDKPRVVATLIDPEERRTVTALAVADGAVSSTYLGYSATDVPSCCPDVEEDAKWRWDNGAFVRSAPARAHAV
ncbi:hypothetical protein [Streptomyces sp. CRN 30]|uniref:hypothetical protein n=1 Tax=Streptomyces sp. CRN 30 TaxID=3075613 RepID=UPI002A7F43F0|nr:hypothetical protein [Streptomyces sp. CRN 30]